MDLTEIKELYSEELNLLKRIQEFGSKHSDEELERVEAVVMVLLYRIYSNLFSSMLLTGMAYKREKVSLFQLPIGILLRCAFTDCLFALYIQRIDEEKAIEELELRAIEYANSLLERKEVFRDQVKSTGKIENDKFIDHIWELTMEDNFLHLLTFDENKRELEVTKRSKEQLKGEGFTKSMSVKTKEVMNFLITIPELKTMSTRLYHYFKYFSQYEHFSGNGQGDVLVSSEEDGNDNIHFPSAIRALNAGVEEIMKQMEKRAG